MYIYACYLIYCTSEQAVVSASLRCNLSLQRLFSGLACSIEQPSMSEKIVTKEDEEKRFRAKAGLFLASVAGMSAIIGFGSTLASAKKSDPKYFNKGIVPTLEMRETGAMLALRALGWGTFYAFTGCGILFYGIWKISGAKDLKEFRFKIGSILPRIPKNDPPQGRTEFEGLNDLMEYLSTLKSDKDKE